MILIISTCMMMIIYVHSLLIIKNKINLKTPYIIVLFANFAVE
jgi:hypothetical protein